VPGTDGDVVVRNDDDREYDVTVTVDRGPAYDDRTLSASLDANGEHGFGNALPRTDTSYPFYLSVSLDGEFVGTTEHQWDSEVELTIRDGEVFADEETSVAEFTPERGDADERTPTR